MGWGGSSKSKVEKTPPTAEERESARTAAIDFNTFQEKFVPAEEQLKDRVRATEGELQDAQGIATGAVEQAAAGSNQGIVEKALSAGVDQGSSRAKLTQASLQNDIAGARAAAGVGAVNDREDAEIRGLTKLSAIGRGLADTSAINLRSAGSQKTSDAIRQNTLEGQRISNSDIALSTASGLAGTVAGYKLGQR